MSCTLAALEYPYVVGDFGQRIEVGLLLNGLPADLTEASQVTMRLSGPSGFVTVLLPCIVLGDPTLGQVAKNWSAEITAPGVYHAEWVVDYPDRELTFPRGDQEPLRIVARGRI